VDRRRFLLLAGSALVSACAGGTQTGRPEDALVQLYANPAKDDWPDQFRQLPAATPELYRYAASHDVPQYIPCFCGSVNSGYGSNFDCYVREVYPDGRVRLDTMSFG
jgi:hypothetical protein